MRRVVGRVFGVASAVVLAIASVVPVSAQSSDSVNVTGEIVSAPLSITISTASVDFGNIDYKATTQPPTASATGFVVGAGDNGAQWVANTAINVSIESPGTFTARVCITNNNGLPPNLIYILDNMPANATDANTAFTAPTAGLTQTCPPPMTWKTGVSGTHSYAPHLGMWIQSNHTPQDFSATVVFSVTAGP